MKKTRPARPPLLARIFGLDLRSLAAFRMGIAAFVLYDLVSRAFNLTAHYTDAGILPRQWALQYYSQSIVYQSWNPAFFSIHMLAGSTPGVAIIFLIHALAALALFFGMRTRLMTFAVWYLLASLHARNPLVLSVGDDVARTGLFFAIWLPLGARYSLDAALNSEKQTSESNCFVSMSSAAFYIQFISIYFFSALLKSGAEWRSEGSALYYAFNYDQFALPLGKALVAFPQFLKALTFAAWWVELLGALLLLIPYAFAKPIGVILILMLQIGIGLTLSLGHNPWINCIALLPFLPGWVWRTPRERKPVEIIYDGDCGFCRKAVSILIEFLNPTLMQPPHPAQGHDLATLRREKSWIVRDQRGPESFRFDAFIRVVAASRLFFWVTPVLRVGLVRKIGQVIYRLVARQRSFLGRLFSSLRFKPMRIRPHWSSEVIAVFGLIAVLVYNISNMTEVPVLTRAFRTPTLMVRLEQYWGMFAPAPSRDDGWYVFAGQLRNGSHVDAFRETPGTDEHKPPRAAAFYPNERWRRYLINLATRDFKDFRMPLAGYLCSNWNAHHPGVDHLVKGSIVFMREVTPPPGQPPQVERLDLNDFTCGP